MTSTLGRFCWYDLMTTEPDAAIAFYGKIVGWGTQAFGGETPYTMWTRGETPLGGVMALQDEMREAGVPPHWIGYVSVPNVDASLEKATELGGKVVVPGSDVENIGRWGVLSDPQGAHIALYTNTSGEAPPPDAPPTVGEFSWHELATTDYEGAFAFYETLFGWHKAEAMDMGGGMIYQMFGRGEMPVGGMFNKTAEMPGPPAWTFYAKVKSVDESAKEVVAEGGQVLAGPMDVPGGDRVVTCLDPQGAVFALHSSAAG